ncbi:MAG: sulfatase-like hydrolase/transferase [Elusimicrobia bacterium]|nr:sulfatase-like hydrolase/transferase [Elusimicrobiota bacterium]
MVNQARSLPLLLALLAAFSPLRAAAPAAPRGIVLLDLVGLPAEQSALEREAPGAVVFAQAVAQGGAAAPSAASLLASQYVQNHGLVAPGDHISTAAATMAEALGRAGYATAGFAADAGLDLQAGLARGFAVAGFQAESSSTAFRQARDGALRWLAAQRGPFFLYLHGARPAPESLEAVRALRQAAPAGSWLILTAGVGPGGGPELGERSVHVPLLIWSPGLKPRRVAEVVRLVDLGPALLEWAKAAVPDSFQGASLAPLAEGGSAAPRYGFSASGTQPGKPTLFSIRDGGWQMIYDKASGEARLFDLKADPDMKTDLSESRPDIGLDLTQRLMRHLRETKSSGRRGEQLSPELLRQMREKGYW